MRKDDAMGGGSCDMRLPTERREELCKQLIDAQWEPDALVVLVSECEYLTENRRKHILGVADQMGKFAREMIAGDGCFASECRVLGLLHDIGYALSDSDGRPHEEIGGELLRDVGYAHWQEVRFHGLPSHMRDGYDSELLMMLNLADMSVRGDGCVVTMDERIEDIAGRYGWESPMVGRAQEMKSELDDWLDS